MLVGGLRMANPNPNESTRWKPGQSGNPGGMSKEVRDKIRINAEKAVYAQGLFLDGILSKLEGAVRVGRQGHDGP